MSDARPRGIDRNVRGVIDEVLLDFLIRDGLDLGNDFLDQRPHLDSARTRMSFKQAIFELSIGFAFKDAVYVESSAMEAPTGAAFNLLESNWFAVDSRNECVARRGCVVGFLLTSGDRKREHERKQANESDALGGAIHRSTSPLRIGRSRISPSSCGGFFESHTSIRFPGVATRFENSAGLISRM